MKLRYYADTDPLHIDLADRPSADSREVTPGVVLGSVPVKMVGSKTR